MAGTIFFEELESMNAIKNYPVECFYNDVVPYLSSSLLHWHYFCELVCIHEGFVEVHAGGKTCVVGAGDVIYIHPQQVHEIISACDGYTAMTLLKFDTALLLSHISSEIEESFFLPFLMKSGLPFLYFEHAAEKIEPFLSAIISEISGQAFGSEVRVRAAVVQIIAALRASLSQDDIDCGAATLTEEEYAKFRKAMQYISEHYAEKNLIQNILDILCISYSSFAVKFKKLNGKTFSEYLNHVRISEARHQLLNSNEPVAVISESCGYTDPCYFNRIFKRLVGVSPLSYRKNNL